MQIWKVVLAGLLLTLGLAACGGGGDDGYDPGVDPPTPVSVSGVVADGYLVGAVVFSDQNGNKSPDSGEPKTTTGVGGKYTLEGLNVDKHPIVVKVDTNVIDEDSNTNVAKPYLLSAPAGKPEFISPMTTLVQQQMEKNPAITAEQAEKVVLTQSGTGVEVTLFKDYVAEKGQNTEYEKLHKVAQVVAATLGEMQGQVETAANEAGYVPEEILDALVQIVTDRVMERLAEMAISVSETAPEAFDPAAIAGTLATQAEAETPIAGTIIEKIEEAQTPAVVSSFKVIAGKRRLVLVRVRLRQ